MQSMDNSTLLNFRFFLVSPRQQRLAAVVLFLATSIAAPPASAQSGERTGKQVVDSVCATCHQTGAKGAPKIGDAKAWANRASRGLTDLTENALKGIRNMPAHGGNMALTDIEIERAITYMVNSSGGKQVGKAQCAKCHQSGVDGAPKIGDRDAWLPRLKRGLDLLVRSAINGHGPMPPRGGMADLTDSEMRGAITYMYNPDQVPAKGLSTAMPAALARNQRIVSGTEIFLGVASAEAMRAQYPKGSAEASMHGGIPGAKGYYHLNVSLFDSKTRVTITDAQVEASVADPVMGQETKKLELVTINSNKSYGNYFRMSGKNNYLITVQIRRPGNAQVIEAKFDFKG
jgi:cytochrome c5